MAKTKRVRTYKQNAVNAIIFAVVLALCVYMAIQMSRDISPQVSTQRTQTVTDHSYAYLEGYVFRLEDRVVASEGTVVDYTVRDGEKVGVGFEYACLYSATGLDPNARNDKESQLMSLSERMRLIESGLKHSNQSSDLYAIGNEIAEHYYSYVNLVTSGDLIAANKVGDKLLSSMVEYSVSTGGDTAKNVIAELESQKNAIVATLGSPHLLVSEQGFNFMYSSDGYESIFSSDKLDLLTPEGLKQLAQSQPQAAQGKVIGRRIYSPKWYLAVPANESTYLEFIEGAIYDVSFSDVNGITIDMTLEKICVDEANENSAYMLFSSYDLATAATFSRTQSIRICLGSCSGYRVPTQAVYNGDQFDYVYVLVGNTVEMRRVSIIGEGNGYYIVDTYENDLKDNVSSEIPYLRINDLLITSGNDLYDGKLLD
ncbi:MAG: hypothetical protein E7649_06610 [Ruminococcaceae bacterium]|nr:hypothetical protein [Oscillospiraceae bacterium]